MKPAHIAQSAIERGTCWVQGQPTATADLQGSRVAHEQPIRENAIAEQPHRCQLGCCNFAMTQRALQEPAVLEPPAPRTSRKRVRLTRADVELLTEEALLQRMGDQRDEICQLQAEVKGLEDGRNTRPHPPNPSRGEEEQSATADRWLL